MPASPSRRAALLSVLFLAGCGAGEPWPNLADVPPALRAEEQKAPPPPAPPPSAGEAAAATEAAAGAVAALAARLPLHRDRLARIEAQLAAQRDPLAALVAAGRPTGDRWSQAQAELSRLGDDIDLLRDLRDDVAADTAQAARALADVQPAAAAAIEAPARVRLDAALAGLTDTLAALGALDAEIAAAAERWVAESAAIAARLQVGAPPPQSVEEAADRPAPAPRLRRKRPGPQAETAAPAESGDRFKGRQALVTLTFEDPALDFEARLRALIEKVRAQYPDIAFDVETLEAPSAQLDKVRALLRSMDVPAAVYRGAPAAGAAPAIKLYPR
jgi:hypothetical protein